MSTKTLISVAEFDRLVEPDDLRYELDEGELIEMTRPRVGHNRRNFARQVDPQVSQ